MLGSPILDVAIGLALIYLLLSLVCTALNEWIAGLLNWRAATLKEALRKLLDAPPDGSYQLRTVDIKDGRALSNALKSSDQPSATIRGKLNAGTLAAIDSRDSGADLSSELIEQIVAAFNQLIDGPLLSPEIFPAGRVQQATLAKATAATSKGATAPGPQSRQLNRLMLQEYFSDSIASLSDLFYDHPLIKSLESPRGPLSKRLAAWSGNPSDRHPSYIPASRFAMALTDVVSEYAGRATGFKEALSRMPDSDVKRSLESITRHGADAAQEIQSRVETWFDESMQRVSGKYKRKTQAVTLLLAAAVTLLMNADTVQMAHKLWVSPTLRSAAVEAAKARIESGEPTQGLQYDPNDPGAAAQIVSLEGNPLFTHQEQDFLTELVGWRGDRARLAVVLNPPDGSPSTTPVRTSLGWLFSSLIPSHFAGWLITILALSLGAPFWFDLLNKFVNIRSSGKKPEESPKAK